MTLVQLMALLGGAEPRDRDRPRPITAADMRRAAERPLALAGLVSGL